MNTEQKQERGGIALNEDSDHYFGTRAGQELNTEKVDSWVDQYANTQVKELMLCPNSMRASYASKVWDPIWRDYDPDAPDDQLLFASLTPEQCQQARKCVDTAYRLHKSEIDIYERWINRCRKCGISPWLSMRMNDVHHVNDEKGYSHSEFWRNNPHLRRVSYRFCTWRDRAFDYGRAEVREYYMKLIRELAERYDFDGLELDWMRFGFHFRPGYESEGVIILNDFVKNVRNLLNDWEQKRGHKICLGARVPSRPHTSVGLGMDAITWAREKWMDMLVITPFFRTIETDMPVEIWKRLLEDTEVVLATGLEVLIQSYPGCSSGNQTNSLETVCGAAASMLDRGADRIYLFNYMDSETAIEDICNYPRLLREIGSIDTMRSKPRRHILTYADTWAPGEPQAILLPVICSENQWVEFRIHTGPKPDSDKILVILGIEGDAAVDKHTMEVRVNGEICDFVGPIILARPKPDFSVYGFNVPLSTMKRGYNLIEVTSKKKLKFGWVEIYINFPGQF